MKVIQILVWRLRERKTITNHNNMHYPIAAVGGCRGDLSAIRSVKHNIRMVHIQSEEFKDFLASLPSQHDWKDKLEEIRNEANENHGSGRDIDHDEWQMLIPVDVEKPLTVDIL